MEDKIAVLYSIQQQCTHIETLREYIMTNIELIFSKNEPVYFLIGVVDTHEEANELCKTAWKNFNKS